MRICYSHFMAVPLLHHDIYTKQPTQRIYKLQTTNYKLQTTNYKL